MHPIQRALMNAGGFLCVALGLIGVVVPGMPTTVFMLTALSEAWCAQDSNPYAEYFCSSFLTAALSSLSIFVCSWSVAYTSLPLTTVFLPIALPEAWCAQDSNLYAENFCFSFLLAALSSLSEFVCSWSWGCPKPR